MERLTSLINKLEQHIKQGADTYELLSITAQIKQELVATSEKCEIVQQNSVAVWLPAGYKAIVQEPAVLEKNTVATAILPATEQPAVVVQEEIVFEAPIVTPVVPKAPAPPRFVEAVEPEPVLVALAQAEPPSGPLFYQLEVEDEEPMEEIIETPAKQPEPKLVEKPFPQYPDAAELIKSIFQAPPVSKEVAKEVNELVLETAVPLNQHLYEKKVELAEVLAAGPKISDLRKAITINEKYQMINMLFRGDDNMFERSIKTLNNFGSLPEARFWMQRELALKLGWNEEDELVQHFYKLVSRRFS